MEQKLRALIKEAMLEKNKNKQVTYKNILETAQKTAKKQGANVEVTDEMIVNAAKSEIKQLNDLIGFCKNDAERLAVAKQNIEYCEAILPKMASEQEIIDYLTTENVEKNMGKCMKALKSEFGANLDGRMASGVVKKYIG